MGMPKVKVTNGFSLYFSKEHRWLLENLFKMKITALRPHWIEMVDIGKWNKQIIELANIKYIITDSRFGDDELFKEGWEHLESDREGKNKLWRRKNWKPSLQIFLVPNPSGSFFNILRIIPDDLGNFSTFFHSAFNFFSI